MKSAMAAVGLCLGLAAMPAFAQNITDCQPHDPVQEAADAALIDRAVPLMQARDHAGLAAIRPEVDAALAHAPDLPSLPEQCGNTIVVYSGDPRAIAAVRDRIGSDPRFAGVGIQLRAGLPYATLGFVAGWIAYEQGDLDGASKAYQKGLLNDPGNANLASEYSYTLARLGRAAEALTFIDAFLAGHPGIDSAMTAQLLRRRGYALTELDRYDDALAAYGDSLRLEPANTVATSEIAYINRKKALQN